MKGKTYILARPNFMADYILGAFDGKEDYVVRHHRRKRGILGTIKRFIRVNLPGKHPGLWNNSFFSQEYLDFIHRIKSEDKVVLFAIGNLKDTIILSEELATRNISSMIWDPMRQICHDSERQKRQYVPAMEKIGVRVCTFDRKDALNYGIDFVGQVYRRPKETAEIAIEQDVFFVGADKRRGESIARLAETLEREHITYKFCLLKDKHNTLRNFPILEKSIMEKTMPYSETMDNIRKSSCLVELLQPGQEGMTLRALEALFFGKKLITDNQSIKEEDLYRRENVYVIDDPEQPWGTLREFLEAPYVKENSDLIENYEVETWIKRL